MNGGSRRYIDDGTTGDSLPVAGTKDILHSSAKQVNHSRGSHFVNICQGYIRSNTHTDTSIVTGTEELRSGKVGIGSIRNIHQNIAAVLHLVIVYLIMVTHATAIDIRHRIACGIIRFEVDEGIGQVRFGETFLCIAICIRIFPI